MGYYGKGFVDASDAFFSDRTSAGSSDAFVFFDRTFTWSSDAFVFFDPNYTWSSEAFDRTAYPSAKAIWSVEYGVDGDVRKGEGGSDEQGIDADDREG